jgi:hypothetical protein
MPAHPDGFVSERLGNNREGPHTGKHPKDEGCGNLFTGANNIFQGQGSAIQRRRRPCQFLTVFSDLAKQPFDGRVWSGMRDERFLLTPSLEKRPLNCMTL